MEKIQFTYEARKMFKTLLKEKLKELGVSYCSISGDGTMYIKEAISDTEKKNVEDILRPYGIRVFLMKNEHLIPSIKLCIQSEINAGDLRKKKISSILSDKLGYSYPYLSSRFSAATFMTIEKFCIFIKIEKVKSLLDNDTYPLTDIATQLDYSSTAYLSKQFKDVTGLTITDYQRFISERRESK